MWIYRPLVVMSTQARVIINKLQAALISGFKNIKSVSLAIHRTASSHLSPSYITILSDAILCFSNNRSRQLMFLFLKTDRVHMGDSTSCFWKSWQKLPCKLYFNIALLTPHTYKWDPNGLWKASLCDRLRVRLVLLYHGIVHIHEHLFRWSISLHCKATPPTMYSPASEGNNEAHTESDGTTKWAVLLLVAFYSSLCCVYIWSACIWLWLPGLRGGGVAFFLLPFLDCSLLQL